MTRRSHYRIAVTPMARLSLPHVGSFQEGHRIVTENPLEEVWSRIARLGITRYVRDSLASTVTATAPPPWDDWGPYATIRMRQAVEFWQASRSGSLLTRPLALYYS